MRLLLGSLLALSALIFVAGGASAGTADDPEIVDPAGDTDLPLPGGDVLAGWIEDADDSGFTTVIRLASYDPEVDRLTDHYFSFRIGTAHLCTFVYRGPAFGDHEYDACRFDAARRLQAHSLDSVGNVTTGAPADLRVWFPLSYLGDDAPRGGYTLTDLVVETFDFKRPGHAGGTVWPAMRDHASTDRTYTFAPADAPASPPSPPPETVREATPVAPLWLVGLPLLLLALRRPL
jgi:hypothetical protein